MGEGVNMAVKNEKKVVDKICCEKCEKLKLPANFYVNVHPLFASEKLKVCKDCIITYIGEKDSKGYLDRVLLVLALMDRPFLTDTWDKSERDWSKFIPQISSFPQYKGLAYKDSDFNNKKITNTEKPSTLLNFKDMPVEHHDTTYTYEELSYLSRFWGKGLDNEELEFLQTEYEKFINSYECDSYAMELLFQEASQQRLTIKKLRAESKSVDKELKTLQDLLGSANIKPAQESGANATEQATFGTLIKKYENERPIPEPDPAWKDVDGIKKYISVWFLGHFSKMVGVKNEHSDTYDEEMNLYKVEPPKFEEDFSEESGDIT